MLERIGPAMEPGEGQMGNVGLRQDSACHRRFRTEASDRNLGFRGARYTRARKARRWSREKVRPAIARHLLPSAAETVERDHVLFVPGLPESSQQVTVHLDPVRFRVEGRDPRAG